MLRKFSVRHLDLGLLILGITLGGFLLALANTVFSSYNARRDLIITGMMETNRVYAHKLAQSLDTFLASAAQELAYTAAFIVPRLNEPAFLERETRRLLEQNRSFNAAAIVDAQGKARTVIPGPLPEILTGSVGADILSNLGPGKPRVSRTFFFKDDHPIVMLWEPIHGADGSYQGYVAGVIYLDQQNVLHSLVGTHYYQKGSYLYITDRGSRLIYHPEPERVGEKVPPPRGLPETTEPGMSATGIVRTINSRHVDMLAGYAYVLSSGWRVVAQTPVEEALEPLKGQMQASLLNALPLALVSFLFLWGIARQVAKPMQRLAKAVDNPDLLTASEQVKGVTPWYFEVQRLKQAMLANLMHWEAEVSKLNLAALTDPLTGLVNRRGLENALNRYAVSQQAFAIVSIDIDHFKRVNDTHGHAVGDQVLRRLARILHDNLREKDLICRAGGEEFLVLLPGLDIAIGAQMAERLRAQVEQHEMPIVGRITISLGVSTWPKSDPSQQKALELADKALYRAKRQGRNQVVLCTELEEDAGPPPAQPEPAPATRPPATPAPTNRAD
jgi:diguanylate cyclase (GGDEF)-like protein